MGIPLSEVLKSGVNIRRRHHAKASSSYNRPGADGKVRWAPPSALRRIDLILCDEGSQWEDEVFDRFFLSVREQPHKPFCTIVADFQQLQAVVSGGNCRRACLCMDKVELKTIYRSTDEQHLAF